MTENRFQRLQPLLPKSANELVATAPYCGPLQVLSASDEQARSLNMSLFFPLPSFDAAISEKATAPPPEEKTVSTDIPIFEPFHTVDYFASQGVKPPSLENPSDRFGQQLKSFTDWLKVMKKLPLTEITRQIPVEKEKQVAALAHHSLDEKQVWTEAMAEVWIKQGERQKAIQIYQKLSLLDPPKSAYFAAKIDALKTES